jgi:hypothetical protein
MTEFSTRDLPLLGVTWRRFPTLQEAKRFAAWAERSTRRDQYPCEALVYTDDRNDPKERFEVKVSNW